MVHSASDGAGANMVNGQNMYYCRTGNNQGIYRSANVATSQTTPTFVTPWPNVWAVGDTFAVTTFGLGRQKMQIDALSMYISNADPAAYAWVHVLSMDLRVAGQESAQFRFEPFFI
jgi:hypothetical protein